MPDFKPEEHIDEFLRNELSHEDKERFEAALISDPALQDKLEIRRDVHDILELKSRSQLKELIRKIDKERSMRSLSFWQRPLAIAATLAIMIVSGVLIFSNLRYADSSIIKRHATAYEDRVSVLGKTDDLIGQAMQYYIEKDYERAISGFDAVDTVDINYPLARLYLGICYVMTEDHRSAIEILGSIKKDNPQEDVIAWYLALAYIGNGDPIKARELLENENQMDTDYRKSERMELLKELNSFWRNFTF